MIINQKEFFVKDLNYTIRFATKSDAEKLSDLRLQIDGESENMDREKGEDFIDPSRFADIIETDTSHARNLFLVAELDGRLIGYSRCVGSDLKRFIHKVEFGLGVRKAYWGYGIGKNLMKETISWADLNRIKKIVLNGVLETNERGIEMYKRLGFEIEGTMKKDRVLSDGRYYNTYIMARFNEC
ncbi:GNAT family N-acetyltransferase [Peribacillus deserti]|uniref:GNAT family N-acetyltransferase n=1 Tax=Peribacillus deserti TaxID=673318 RepID=A0A2N5M443_9BACI|nr:GNAT family N-acetyltransferase [Peribacillus deserti]PLT29095.1 GNAT family N-acetyltransferase [Peribacillus deserti]